MIPFHLQKFELSIGLFCRDLMTGEDTSNRILS
jgi:hypothetical protein